MKSHPEVGHRSAYDQPTLWKAEMGARLSAAREAAGMNQHFVAKALGYSQAVQLSNIENGNRKCALDIALACAKLYDVSTDYILGLSPAPTADIGAEINAVAAGAVGLPLDWASDLAGVTRQLWPLVNEADILASEVLKLCAAIQALRGGPFDETAGGATVMHRVEAVWPAAERVMAKGNAARELARARPAIWA